MLTEDQKKQLRQSGTAFFADEAGFDEMHPYLTDRSRTPGAAEGVIFPETTRAVEEIVRFARQEKLPLVPSGGRTGYAGGAAARGGLVVSLERMNRLLSVHPEVPALHVEAGMITEEVQTRASEMGFEFPVDFAAAGSSQIGGNIATNAGGVRVVRSGMMRAHVSGLTVVAGTGETLRLQGALRKDNTGPDLKQLFIGSEGILGIITEAMLLLSPPLPPQTTALAGLERFDDVIELLVRARRTNLSAFEVFDRTSLSAVRAHLGLPEPLAESAWYVLFEFDETDFDPGPFSVSIAATAQHRETMWKYRESISESLSFARVHKNDISIPQHAMSRYAESVRELARELGIELAMFGHAADGNLHVNLVRPPGMSEEAFTQKAGEFTAFSYDAIQAAQGSISAEHGIGLLKREEFLSRAPRERIEFLRAIKAVFDPDGIMNPGKVI